jgi:hypothetical protein
MSTLWRILTACTLLGLAVSGQAMQLDRSAAPAGFDPARGPELELAAFQGSGKTLSEAVEQVRRQYGGRIVSAETRVSGGREVHIIKVLTDDGKVKTVRVPGRKL